MPDISSSLLYRLGRWLRTGPRSLPTRTAAVLLLVVPTLLSAVYMWIMWDPEVYLPDVPVAVASDDIGAVRDGATQNLGSRILDDLVSSHQVDFRRVSSAEAVQGLRENRYAFSVVIPAEFTRDILTITDAKPHPARIMVWYNDFNGTLGPALAGNIVSEADKQITASIGREYAAQVLVGVNSLGSGLADAASGAAQLADGSDQLDSGASQLATGLDQANTGVGQLLTGAGQLHNGATQLADGTNQLLTGIDQLGIGANQIRDGVAQIVDPIQSVLTRADRLATTMEPLLDQLAASGDPTLVDAVAQARSLTTQVRATNPDSLTGQLTQLRNGSVELARQLSDPTADYRAGVIAVAQGSTQLRDGAAAIEQGTRDLSTGIGQLDAGADQLHGGSTQLRDGARQLASALRDGAAQAPQISDPAGSADMFAEPFHVDIDNQAPSQVIVGGDRTHKRLAGGAGPVLVTLGAFFVMVVAWMLLPARRPATGPTHLRVTWALARGLAPGVGIGVLAAGAAAAYGAYLGWHPHTWQVMALVVGLVGMAAASTTHVFVVLAGRVFGAIAAFAFFMFQTFAFGGIFPPGTTPLLFQPFQDLAPMTFARRAILRCDLALYDHMFWVSILVLIAMILAAIVVAITVEYVRFRTCDESPDSPGGAVTAAEPQPQPLTAL